ncbi:universal stress protein [uncultured Azohydromonas sp.]|jgi:Universal stress protein UspA and related nucleotide-binding proteins|uniref:universal stress protein n=1 Tax=uncultured Azohydromonas sp. TaxID=487342 RepID=UPI00262981D8|nr:universal stress protein [uncultured Azohydromonas sp.]
MDKVYACIDGQANTTAVIDWAIWSAGRLDTPLEFLHMLERASVPVAGTDYSGAIGLGSQEALLQELASLDEQRARVAQELGGQLLAAARERAATAGVARHDGRLRHGELASAALELEGDARLFVLGRHPHAAPSRMYLDHHVEQLVRAVHRPVLVVPGEHFVLPERVVIAFDGSATAWQAVERVATSPLLAGLPLVLAFASDKAAPQEVLLPACERLRAAGFDVAMQPCAGEPDEALPQVIANHAAGLLVMGAYGHSRIRQFLLGSTTTTLLRLSEVPVLILR